MFCNKCGNHLDDLSKFCNKCGNQITYEKVSFGKCHDSFDVSERLYNKCENFFNTQALKESNIQQQTLKNKIDISVILIATISIIIITLVIINYNKKGDYYTIPTTNEPVENYTYTNNFGKTSIDPSHYISSFIQDENTYKKELSKISNEEKQKCSKPSTLKYEEELMKKYKLYSANLCEISDEYLEQLLNIYSYAEKEYSGIFDYAYATQILYDANSQYAISLGLSNSIAAYGITDSIAGSNGYNYRIGMFLNTNYFLNESYFLQTVTKSSNAGHFPPNSTIYSPIIHELGHKLHYDLVFKKYNISNFSIINNNNYLSAQKAINDLTNSTTTNEIVLKAIKNIYKLDNVMDISIYTKQISAYATTSSAEAIAESVHDYYLNKDKAKELSKEIVKLLKEERAKYF